MTAPLWLCGGAGALVVGALAGWTVRDWKADSEALKAKETEYAQYQALTDELANASLAYEALAQTLRTAERTDRETIREIYRNVQVPAQCAAPAGAVSVLNNAIDRANAAATGQPVRAVPDAP